VRLKLFFSKNKRSAITFRENIFSVNGSS